MTDESADRAKRYATLVLVHNTKTNVARLHTPSCRNAIAKSAHLVKHAGLGVAKEIDRLQSTSVPVKPCGCIR